MIDAINFDAAANEVMDAVGFPEELKRPAREIMAIRQQRNQMAQQERTAENFPKIARGAASLAKAPEQGSLVQKLLEPGSESPAQ